MVSISKQQSGPVHVSYGTVKEKKRDITSLLGQMCPPAALSTSFGKLGPVVPLRAWWVIGPGELPVVTVVGACLVIVDGASCLNRGRGSGFGEGAR
jgi:hypothetical protein